MSYLAIDLGASTGRAVIGTLDDGGGMSMREIHRFRTPMIERDGHLFWDIDEMWVHIRSALSMAFESGEPLRSVSVDSWAVDYVPLGREGNPLRLPYCYRDRRTARRLETAIRLAGGADALFDRTGIQFLAFNTLPQIIADVEDAPDVVRRTATRLFIAEYFLYRLSGKQVAEATMASTTQLVDVRTGRWSTGLLDAIGDDERRWPQIVPPGTVLGPLLPDLVPSDTTELPRVVASCAHDTAAAVAAVPATGDHSWAYISSGTWSLVGAERAAPLLTRVAREAGFTNEVGLDGTVRFLINRAGMWVLDECRREWEEQGISPSHEALLASAAESPSLGGTVDLNAQPFAERGGMVAKLAAACKENGMPPPSSAGATARFVLESLAASHAAAIRQLEQVTDSRVEEVHIVGGGALNNMLNQWTADRCDRRVLAGPEEATVLGNLLVQARTLGDLPAGVSVRTAAQRSTRIREFIPRHIAPGARPAQVTH